MGCECPSMMVVGNQVSVFIGPHSLSAHMTTTQILALSRNGAPGIYRGQDFASLSPVRHLKFPKKRPRYLDLDEVRPAFEHGRLLYHLVNNLVTPKDYRVPPPPPFEVASFVYLASGLVTERTRTTDPAAALQYGFLLAPSTTLSTTTAPITHIQFDNKALANINAPGRTTRISFSNTQPLESTSLKTVLSPRKPTVLLLYDAEASLKILTHPAHGIQKSLFVDGIQDLLGYNRHGLREHNPPAKYYYLDMKLLFHRLTSHIWPEHLKVFEYFNLWTHSTGMSAGLEAKLLLDVWKDMIQGDWIDQQRLDRQAASRAGLSRAASTSTPAPAPAPQEIQEDDDDSDFDPNVTQPIIPSTNIRPQPPSAPAPVRTYDDYILEKDEDYLAEDSDSDSD